MFEWMQEYDMQSYNIDVRRFTSFGVIKVSYLIPSISRRRLTT